MILLLSQKLWKSHLAETPPTATAKPGPKTQNLTGFRADVMVTRSGRSRGRNDSMWPDQVPTNYTYIYPLVIMGNDPFIDGLPGFTY